ncbi:hypothetical protein FisN_9Lh010 [Fistulifera solaris]|uniref:L domain-like protein n=1 Tax=Fistulifera solaris TaxID=1519565 RepID=A0A1Z5KIN1_FISSO|nr:hypothetical protein FisN_9Lh010 [Fistulifera solaris]|eukprot:GAX25808.1 hypothetical protein FisN_9Lh010 [Fistulifera solaris]
MELPITPPQSPKTTQAPQPKTHHQISTLQSAPPRATARVISQAPNEEQIQPNLPPKTYESPSGNLNAKQPDEGFRASSPPKTYQLPSRSTRSFDEPYQSPSRSMRSPMRSSSISTTRSRSLSPRRSRYDSSPFKSMRSPSKSVRGPPRSTTSSSRSVSSLPTPPPMPFYRDGMSFASESEYPLEEIEEIEADKSSMRTWFIFLFLGVVLLLAIVGTVMAFAIQQANQDKEPTTTIVVPEPDTQSPSPIDAPTLAPVSPVAPNPTKAPVAAETAPTNSPQSFAPTILPTNVTESDGFTARFPDVFTRLSTFFTNDQGASIRLEGTPQYRAYLWLEEDIVLQDIEPNLDARLIQRYALAVFYFSTNGDTWTRGENWLSASDECLWQTDAPETTSCNGNTSPTDVSQLVFDKNNIGGTLPAELSILTNLEILSIVNDPTGAAKITGTIPPEFSKLTTIREFVIKNHDMSNATIPSSLFLEWPRATLVLMERCKLIGKIPTTVGLLTSSTKVSFRKNDLTGPLPTEVGSLRSMLQLSVDANRLTGTIPTELGLLVNAKGVWVNNNNFVGPIPNEFGNLKLIKAGLRFSDNELTGTIPSSLVALTDMKNLELQNNFLTGPVPDLGALSSLSMLNVRGNELSGFISDATCAAIVAGGAEAYADCPGEVACACCLNCPQSSTPNATVRRRVVNEAGIAETSSWARLGWA